MEVADQVMSIYAGTKGYLDNVQVNEVQKWEIDFLAHVHASHQDLYDAIVEKQKMDDELEQQLINVINGFNEKHGYVAQEEEALA